MSLLGWLLSSPDGGEDAFAGASAGTGGSPAGEAAWGWQPQSAATDEARLTGGSASGGAPSASWDTGGKVIRLPETTITANLPREKETASSWRADAPSGGAVVAVGILVAGAVLLLAGRKRGA